MTTTEEERRILLDIDKEQREDLRHLQKEAFQLANYYFVFQGVIFTGFYNSPSALKCHYHWVPFVLSFLAGFLNLCALANIAFKYKRKLDERHRTNGVETISQKLARYWRLVYVVSCLGFFAGFFCVTLFGSWKIPCGGNELAANPPK